MIRILQINVGVWRAAQDLALATASDTGVDVLVLSEPYRCGQEAEGWFSDIDERAAILALNRNLQIQTIGPKDNRGFRWIKVEDITIYACYWSPNTAYTLFVDFLDRLEGSIKQQEPTIIVAGDFNAKSTAWGDHSEEPKGRALGDMAASLGLAVCNKGDRPTFSRVYAGGISWSHIDVTFVSERDSTTVRDWQVLDQYTASLHSYIKFDVTRMTRPDRRQAEARWSWRKYEKAKLVEYIQSTSFETETDASRTSMGLNKISRVHATAACRGERTEVARSRHIGEQLRFPNSGMRARRRGVTSREAAIEERRRRSKGTRRIKRPGRH